MEIQFKTKQLNIWCQSAQTWIPNENIVEVSQSFNYDMFDKEKEYAILGVDISERSDLCVVTSLVEHNSMLYLL